MNQIADGDSLLEELTREAIDAATQGKWDQVSLFYERRTRDGLLGNVSPNVAKKLIQYDQWLMTRIREVQALTQLNLGEAQGQRRHLESLKRKWVGHYPAHARHRLSV